MPDFSPRLVCWTVIWLAIFSVAVVISIVPLHKLISATCVVLQISPGLRNDDDKCTPTLLVRVNPDRDEGDFEASPELDPLDCDKQDEFIENHPKDSEAKCYYVARTREVNFISNNREEGQFRYAVHFSNSLRKAATAMAVWFGICAVISFSCMFKPELMRCCPPFVWALLSNILAIVWRARRPRGEPPAPDEEVTTNIVRRPPIAASRRKISALVEATKLSDEEVQALKADGWSCCVCLEEELEGRVSDVSRLHCGHATHSECLRAWLEKGRAVCCLCNTEVFPGGLKEAVSGRTSVSGYDGGPPGSLDVERTEGAPSSPATSIFVDISQARSLEPRSSDDHDRDV